MFKPVSGTALVAARRSFRVLLTGDNESPSSPNRTLARALEREGLEAAFRPDLPKVGGHEWLRELRNTDAIIHVEYEDPDPYSARQLAIATTLRRPVIRWWVGTDVLLCTRERALQKKAMLIEGAGAYSVASAQHLVQELKSVGLTAWPIPPPLDSRAFSQAAIIPEVPRAVLVYLPTYRLQFYGADSGRELARLNRDLRFIVVGDESHSFRDLPNVTSLGWVADMETVYREIGCVLRLTEHDAVPRMLADALLRGRYAIHSWPLEGCWLARSVEEAHEKLKLFRAVAGPNVEGASAIKRLYEPPPEARLAQLMKTESRRYRIGRRAVAALLAARLTVEGRMKGSRRS